MKKISFLLLGVFLLFPVAIYVGNLADIPASKKVVVYFRDLIGLSDSQETTDFAKVEIIKMPATYSHVGLVESWRDLGTSNFADLLQLITTPDNHDKWRTVTDGFLSDPLHSAAFFSSSWSFWQAQQEKLTLIGYYQPWIDVLLFIQVAEVNGSYKAVAIGVTEPKNATIAPTTPTAMAQELTARLGRAEQVFQSVIQNPNALDNMLNPAVVEKSAISLDLYVSDLRSKLAANNSGNQDRSAILDWLNALQTGQVKEVQALTAVSNDWLKQLQVVELVKIDAEQWLLAASNPSQAERVLLVQLRISDHKALVTEVQIWDAATAAGGVQ